MEELLQRLEYAEAREREAAQGLKEMDVRALVPVITRIPESLQGAMIRTGPGVLAALAIGCAPFSPLGDTIKVTGLVCGCRTPRKSPTPSPQPAVMGAGIGN